MVLLLLLEVEVLVSEVLVLVSGATAEAVATSTRSGSPARVKKKDPDGKKNPKKKGELPNFPEDETLNFFFAQSSSFALLCVGGGESGF